MRFYRELLLGGASGDVMTSAVLELSATKPAGLSNADRLRRRVALILASPEAQLC